MKCARCGAVNPDGSRVCQSCGARLTGRVTGGLTGSLTGLLRGKKPEDGRKRRKSKTEKQPSPARTSDRDPRNRPPVLPPQARKNPFHHDIYDSSETDAAFPQADPSLTTAAAAPGRKNPFETDFRDPDETPAQPEQVLTPSGKEASASDPGGTEHSADKRPAAPEPSREPEPVPADPRPQTVDFPSPKGPEAELLEGFELYPDEYEDEPEKTFSFASAAEKLKSLSLKTVGILGGSAAALLLLIVLIVSLVSGGGDNYVRFSGKSVTAVNTDDGWVVVYGGEALSGTYDEAPSFSRSMEGGTVVFRCGEAVYSIRRGKAEKLAENVSAPILSVDGSTVLYWDGETGALWSVPVSGGDRVMVLNESEGRIGAIVASPDGKSVAYCVDDGADGWSLYFCRNRKKTRLAKDGVPVSVSDNGGTIYYSDAEGNLFVTDSAGREQKKIASGFTAPCGLNASCDELLFSAEGKIWLTARGGEKTKLSGSAECTVVKPSGTVTGQNGSCAVFPLKSFRGAVLSADTDIGIVKKDGSFEKLAHDVGSYSLSDDGSGLFYLRKGSLFTVAAKEGAEPVRLRESADRYVLSSDGKKIYVLDGDELCCLTPKGREREIRDGVESIKLRGNTLFFRADYSEKYGEGTLFSCSDGKNVNKIAEDVSGFSVYRTMILYESDGETYVSTDGKKFERVR